jgi:multiple sugar transport system permease protein
LPFVWMAMTSLKAKTEIYIYPPRLFPNNFLNFANYVQVFLRQPFGHFIINSLVIATGTTLASLFFSSLAGFAFAKYKFPFKEAIFFGFILSVLMVPFEVTVIPLYLMYSKAHLNNTLLGVAGPSLISAFGIFIMRQFMQGVPDDYIDAARIDGLSEFGIFWKIVLPLCSPALATLGTVKFIWTWNDFLWPLIIAETDVAKTVTLGVANYVGMWHLDFDVVTAATTLSIIPTLLIFVLLQNLVVKGMTLTGLK